MSVRIRRVICPVTLVAAEQQAKTELSLPVARSFPAVEAPELPEARPVTTGEVATTAAQRFRSARIPVYPVATPIATQPGPTSGTGEAGSTAPQRYGSARIPITPIASPVTPESPGVARRYGLAPIAIIPIATPVATEPPPGTAAPQRYGSAGIPIIPIASPVTSGPGTPAQGPSQQAFQSSVGARHKPPVIVREHKPPAIVQKKRSSRAAGLPPFEALRPAAVRTLASAGDSGARLAEKHRAAMEPVVGLGLKDVRIHTGEAAASTAEALGAEAFTVGRDVFFGRGRFDPTSLRGRALLAHELTHVRQQTGSGSGRVLGYDGGAGAGEAEAQAAEQAVLGGRLSEGGLTVGTYVRNYASADGRPLSPSDRARLDAISFKALEVCRQLLGPEFSQASAASIERLEIDLSLDLASLTDDQAAQVWGEAIAQAVRARLQAPDTASIQRLIAESTQLSPAEESKPTSAASTRRRAPAPGAVTEVDLIEMASYLSQPEAHGLVSEAGHRRYSSEPRLQEMGIKLRDQVLDNWLGEGAPLTASQLYDMAFAIAGHEGTTLLLCHNVMRTFARGGRDIPWRRRPGTSTYTDGQYDYTAEVKHPAGNLVTVGKEDPRPSIFYVLLSAGQFGTKDPGDWYHHFAIALSSHYWAARAVRLDISRIGRIKSAREVAARWTTGQVAEIMNKLRERNNVQFPSSRNTAAYNGWLWANAISFLEGAHYGSTQEEVNRESQIHRQGAILGLQKAGFEQLLLGFDWHVPKAGGMTIWGTFGDIGRYVDHTISIRQAEAGGRVQRAPRRGSRPDGGTAEQEAKGVEQAVGSAARRQATSAKALGARVADENPELIVFSRPVTLDEAKRYLWKEPPDEAGAIRPDPIEAGQDGKYTRFLVDVRNNLSLALSMQHGLAEVYLRRAQKGIIRSKAPPPPPLEQQLAPWVPDSVRKRILEMHRAGTFRSTERRVCTFPGQAPWGSIVLWVGPSEFQHDQPVMEMYQYYPEDMGFYQKLQGYSEHAARLHHFARTVWNKDMKYYVEGKKMRPSEARLAIQEQWGEICRMFIGAVGMAFAGGGGLRPSPGGAGSSLRRGVGGRQATPRAATPGGKAQTGAPEVPSAPPKAATQPPARPSQSAAGQAAEEARIRAIRAEIAAARARAADAAKAELAAAKAGGGPIRVNVGGTGEIKGAINLNPVAQGTGGAVTGIPNWVAAKGESIAQLFPRQSIDEIYARKIFTGSVNWEQAAKGFYAVLKPGGKVSLNEFPGGAERSAVIASALQKAGFRDVKVIANVLVEAVK